MAPTICSFRLYLISSSVKTLHGTFISISTVKDLSTLSKITQLINVAGKVQNKVSLAPTHPMSSHYKAHLLIFYYYLEPLNIFNIGLRLNFIIKIHLFNLLGLSLMFLHSVSKTALYRSHPQYSKLSCSSHCLRSINGTYFPLDLRIYLFCNLWMQIFSRFTADKMVSKSYCQT